MVTDTVTGQGGGVAAVGGPFTVTFNGPGQETLTADLKAELQRFNKEARDEDLFAGEQLPNGVDGSCGQAAGK